MTQKGLQSARKDFYIRAMHFRCVYNNVGYNLFVCVWSNTAVGGLCYNVFITF
jgi:hypothetical protein